MFLRRIFFVFLINTGRFSRFTSVSFSQIATGLERDRHGRKSNAEITKN